MVVGESKTDMPAVKLVTSDLGLLRFGRLFGLNADILDQAQEVRHVVFGANHAVQRRGKCTGAGDFGRRKRCRTDSQYGANDDSN